MYGIFAEVGTGKDEWYRKSKVYWEKQPDSDDSCLGGFGEVSPNEIVGSEDFWKHVGHMTPSPIPLGHCRLRE